MSTEIEGEKTEKRRAKKNKRNNFGFNKWMAFEMI